MSTMKNLVAVAAVAAALLGAGAAAEAHDYYRPAPRPAAVWEPGHWEWIHHGRERVWVAGRWVERAPVVAARPGHWEWRYGERVWVPDYRWR